MPKAIRNPSWPMRLALIVIWALLPLGMAGAAVEDGTGKRRALVVGNSSYQSVYSLKNAVNDSEAVAEVLGRLGFEVTSLKDAGKEEFRQAVEDFSRAAEDAETTVFYFSGHGFQLGGANYLVPSDASLTDREAIEDQTLRLDAIIAKLHARDRQTLIFLDACRNNPLPESVRGENAADGLAQIETGSGTFVAFATQPGNVTRDGAGDHSPFTTALLDYIETPGISISDMMIRVRNVVEEQTLQQQTPWDQSSLRSQFYFNPQTEESEELTQEDRDLLLSLDPELRKRFELRFGLRIESVDEADADVDALPEEPLIARIQPAVSIEAMSETDVVVASASETAPVTANLQILPADDEAPPAEDDIALVPIPGARPEGEEEAVAIVRLEPIQGATRTPTPIEPLQVPKAAVAPSDAVSDTRPTALPPSGEPPAPALTAAADTQPAQATREAAPAAPVADGERAVAIASGPDLSLKPQTGGHQRIVGQEAVLEQTTAAAAKLEEIPAPADSKSAALPEAPALVPSPRIEAAEAREPETQLAALDPTEIKPEPIKPLPQAEEAAEDDVDRPDDLPRAIQAELARLGCYRNAIDGIWGSGSARALLRFYATKKEVPEALEPDMVLYARLTTEEVVVCTRTESDKPAKVSKPKPKSETVRSNQPPKGPAPAVANKKRNAPAPAVATETKAKLKKSLKVGAFR